MPALPRPDADSAPHWAAAREGRLAIQRCPACDLLVWYPRARCPRCASAELAYEDVSGRATVHAFTVVHRPAEPGLAVPYVVALVDLAEGGARLMTNLVECDPDDVRVGMAVRVRFRALDDELSVPVFAPDEGD